MASIDLTNEETINVSLSEPEKINTGVKNTDPINIESSDGWYEKKYEEIDPIFSSSVASTITNDDIERWNKGGGTGGGDMYKSTYDTNDNGVVDNAEKVNNHTVEKDVPPDAKFTDTVYDDTSIIETLNNKADKSEIPKNTSDLTNDSGFVKNTDYANSTTGGVIRTSNSYGTSMYSDGSLTSTIKTYDQYLSNGNYMFVSKGTLENVIAGKGLVSNTDYATSSKGGVVKVRPNDYGINVNADGILYARNTNYSQYQSANNNHAISKGTLESVIAGKQLATIRDIPANVSDLTNDSGFINNSVNNLVNYTPSSNLSSVATSGNFNDLINKPLERIYYGTCSQILDSEAIIQISTNVTIPDEIEEGTLLIVTFDHKLNFTPTSDFNNMLVFQYNQTQTPVSFGVIDNENYKGAWGDNETVCFCYDRSRIWKLIRSKKEIGDLEDLNTTSKTNLVTAINEVRSLISPPVWGNITGNLSNQTDLQAMLNSKQNTLVSGTNIKTINGNSVLGSGDITVEQGASLVKYIVTDSMTQSELNAVGQEILNAYNGGKSYGRDYVVYLDTSYYHGTCPGFILLAGFLKFYSGAYFTSPLTQQDYSIKQRLSRYILQVDVSSATTMLIDDLIGKSSYLCTDPDEYYSDINYYTPTYKSQPVSKGYLNDRENKLLTAFGLDTDTYDETSTYAVGDLVVYDNTIYECITAVSIAEAWDSSKWEVVSIIVN